MNTPNATEHWAAKYEPEYRSAAFPRPLGYWIYAVACYSGHLPEDIATAIGAIALREQCGVWHAFALYFDTVDDCNCSTCTAKRRHPVQLECSCCGQYTKGRQWWGRDKGYGLCANCADKIASCFDSRGELRTSPEEMKRSYGVRGVHYDLR